jgi:hypothetical protein
MWLYRLALPAIPGQPDGTHRGRWSVLLGAGVRRDGYRQAGQTAATQTRDVPYDVAVHAYSSLELLAWLTQTDYNPGTRVGLRARLVEYTRVMDHNMDVWAEVADPAGATFSVAMNPAVGGDFDGGFVGTPSGVYAVRIRARGSSSGGALFTRELTLTAVVREGADTPQVKPADRWCDVLRCLSGNPILTRRFGDGFEELLKCLQEKCDRPDSAAALERRAAADPPFQT